MNKERILNMERKIFLRIVYNKEPKRDNKSHKSTILIRLGSLIQSVPNNKHQIIQNTFLYPKSRSVLKSVHYATK